MCLFLSTAQMEVLFLQPMFRKFGQQVRNVCYRQDDSVPLPTRTQERFPVSSVARLGCVMGRGGGADVHSPALGVNTGEGVSPVHPQALL